MKYEIVKRTKYDDWGKLIQTTYHVRYPVNSLIGRMFGLGCYYSYIHDKDTGDEKPSIREFTSVRTAENFINDVLIEKKPWSAYKTEVVKEVGNNDYKDGK